MEILHKLQFLCHTHGAELHDADAAYRHRPGNFRQSVTAALGTGGTGHTLLQFLPGRVGLGLLIPAGNVVHNALKGLFQNAHAVAAVIGHAQFFALGAVKDHILRFLRQFLKRHIQIKMVFLRQCFKIHAEHTVRPCALPAGHLNGAVQHGLCLVRNHQIGVRNQTEAQTCTGRAGTGRIVEREHPGLQLRQTDTTVLAGVVLGKAQFLFCGRQFDDDQSAGMGAGGFNGICQSAAQTFLQHQTVHHQLNIVFFIFLQFDLFRQIVQDAVHSHTGKAALAGILKNFDMFTLLGPHHRRQHNKAGSLTQGFHTVHDLINGLTGNLSAALGAMGCAHPRPQKAQIVIDFRHRTHRRAGILGGGLLVNGNSGRQTFNGIHIGLIHLSQELAGVGGQTFHIAALSFRVNRIKCEAGLAGTGKSRKHNQFISGNGQIDIFQIVLSGTPNHNFIIHTVSPV